MFNSLSNLLFDAPWWLPIGLIGLGVFLFWNGNRRQEKNVRNAGLGAIALAVLVLLLSYYIDTPVEIAVKRSKQLVYAVRDRDWPKMTSILDPSTTVSVLNVGELYVNRNEIVAAARDAVDRHGLKGLSVLSATPEQSDTLITVTLSVMSEHDVMLGRPLPSQWQFDWQPAGKDWVLAHVTCIKIGNMTGDAAGAQFPRPPSRSK